LVAFLISAAELPTKKLGGLLTRQGEQKIVRAWTRTT
jgi:hypothetical protein